EGGDDEVVTNKSGVVARCAACALCDGCPVAAAAALCSREECSSCGRHDTRTRACIIHLCFVWGAREVHAHVKRRRLQERADVVDPLLLIPPFNQFCWTTFCMTPLFFPLFSSSTPV
ncbi:unnamed protein product, partial [Ectocarpus fasciculatus]